MKNRMDVPEEYEPVLPGKVKAHLVKKQAKTDNSLLTQTVIAVGKVIAMLQDSPNPNGFVVDNLTPEQLRQLKSACVNHLAHLIPGIEEEIIE
ncbi:MAG: hypothetical protein OXI63_01780 [Candidatus Poribacteria bacterium]|nr:hypothetical protein [Candidatus Poribacteria bacterium]